jgi:single-stranded-DNA-specific exonuclease
LTGDNRWIVQTGLQLIRTSPRPAIQQICADLSINHNHFTEEHIGFFLAPMLNAIGRLGDANPMVEFLLSDDAQLLSVRSAELRGLNEKRKLQCDQVFIAALAQLQRDSSLLDRPILILHHPTWPGGVIGIVASRLVERFNRPVILFTGGEILRGSGRSIEGINLIQSITAQSALLNTFGGHPMAAGLSLDKELLPAFRDAISKTILETTALPLPPPALNIDAYLTIPEINFELADQIDRLAPFGAGNPALQFALSNVKLNSHRRFSSNKDHLEAIVEDVNQNTLRLVWWQGGNFPLPSGRFDLAFTLHASDYRGVRELQAEWTHARPIETETIEIKKPEGKINWVDHRQATDPGAKLEQILLLNPSVQIWKEGLLFPPIHGVFRQQLRKSDVLVIWNIPSSWDALTQALQRVSPSQIFLFANPSTSDTLEDYLKMLIRLIRYRVNHQNGQVTLEELSAACGLPETMISLSLDYLSARGILQIEKKDSGNLILEMQEGFARVELYPLQQRLRELYNEIKAYQANYIHIPLDGLQSMQS